MKTDKQNVIEEIVLFFNKNIKAELYNHAKTKRFGEGIFVVSDMSYSLDNKNLFSAKITYYDMVKNDYKNIFLRMTLSPKNPTKTFKKTFLGHFAPI
ncbi:MAG: hypothetical protein AABY22_26645 [Nanoarchaeota archaeon]